VDGALLAPAALLSARIRRDARRKCRCGGQPLVGGERVEAAIPVAVVRAGCPEVDGAVFQRGRLPVCRHAGEGLQQERQRAGDVRRGDRRAGGIGVEAVQVRGVDGGARRDQLRVDRLAACGGAATAVGVEDVGVIRRADGEGLRIVRRAARGPRQRAGVSGGEDGKDARGPQACQIGLKSSTQPEADIAHELLTTSGASAVAGLPAGSSSHWNPWWIPVEVAVPRSLNILTAIHVASGATPTELPPASPPTITPIVQVPWPLTSTGVVGCCPFGSYQLLVPPRQRLARAGWGTSTPAPTLPPPLP